MARVAGLPPEVSEALSGHSARVGAAQDMIASGIGLPAVLQAGRWKSPTVVNRYGERLLARKSGAAQLAKLQERAWWNGTQGMRLNRGGVGPRRPSDEKPP